MDDVEAALPQEGGNEEGGDEGASMDEDFDLMGLKKKKKKKAGIDYLLKEEDPENKENGKC